MQGNFPDQLGIIVFPNVDSSHVFTTPAAKVEIDMVLVHQTKGVFIFNVKNVGGSSLSSEKLLKDIKKHKRFIKMLLDYENDTEQIEIPIHSIVCNFQTDSDKFKDLESKSENELDAILVWNKRDLDQSTFPAFWVEKLNSDRMRSVNSASALDVLVARLIALNSLESSLAVIHEQIRSGFLQSLSNKKHLETQIQSVSVKKDKNFKDTVTGLSEIANEKGKKKFILWTKEQINIIAHVYGQLVQPTENKGMRVLVEGCKGSGKTMLLVFIAKLAQRVLENKAEGGSGKVIVCDGSIGNTVLLEQLSSELDDRKWPGVTVLENPSKHQCYNIFGSCI